MKTLILYLAGTKEKQVEIPDEAKITFGPAIPFQGKNGYDRVSEYAVRVYEGSTEKSPLIAVFTGVREFRLATVPVKELVAREAGQAVWKSDESGFEFHKKVKKSKGFVPEDTKGLLPSAAEDAVFLDATDR